MTLGVFPAMSVEDAHDAWRMARDFVQAGRDPRVTDAERHLRRPTSRASSRSGSARPEQESICEARRAQDEGYVLPSWKHRDVREIIARNCLDPIDAIADRGTVVLARRVFSHLHRFFTWAIGRGIIDANPLLHADKPGSESLRERVLDDAELVKVWRRQPRSLRIS